MLELGGGRIRGRLKGDHMDPLPQGLTMNYPHEIAHQARNLIFQWGNPPWATGTLAAPILGSGGAIRRHFVLPVSTQQAAALASSAPEWRVSLDLRCSRCESIVLTLSFNRSAI